MQMKLTDSTQELRQRMTYSNCKGNYHVDKFMTSLEATEM